MIREKNRQRRHLRFDLRHSSLLRSVDPDRYDPQLKGIRHRSLKETHALIIAAIITGSRSAEGAD